MVKLQFGQIFFSLPKTWEVPGSFPFPGGYTIGTALLVNLLAAHAVRFKLAWRRTGILMIHSGIVVMPLDSANAAKASVGRSSCTRRL